MQRKMLASNRARGFSQFELVVVIILISILATVAMSSMWSWRSEFERTLIQTVSGNIRSALGLETAQLALHNKLNQLSKLAGSNPFSLLAQKPDTYLGELSDTHPDTQKQGVWYYSKEQRVLIYTIKYSDSFKSTLEGQPRIRLKIKLIYSDKNVNLRYDPGIDAISGLDLIPLDKYQWY